MKIIFLKSMNMKKIREWIVSEENEWLIDIYAVITQMCFCGFHAFQKNNFLSTLKRTSVMWICAR